MSLGAREVSSLRDRFNVIVRKLISPETGLKRDAH